VESRPSGLLATLPCRQDSRLTETPALITRVTDAQQRQSRSVGAAQLHLRLLVVSSPLGPRIHLPASDLSCLHLHIGSISATVITCSTQSRDHRSCPRLPVLTLLGQQPLATCTKPALPMPATCGALPWQHWTQQHHLHPPSEQTLTPPWTWELAQVGSCGLSPGLQPQPVLGLTILCHWLRFQGNLTPRPSCPGCCPSNSSQEVEEAGIPSAISFTCLMEQHPHQAPPTARSPRRAACDSLPGWT
jgi:hypothetical protein